MDIGQVLDRLQVGLGGRLLRARGMFDGYFQRWRSYFGDLERLGLHVLPVHHYSPIPQTSALPESLWERSSELAGLRIDISRALALLAEIKAFRGEYGAFPLDASGDPSEYHYRNGAYGPGDAEVLYGLVRKLKPKHIIEIGSGYSTLVTASAVERNRLEGHTCEFVAIEPFPKPMLRAGIPGLTRLLEKPLEQVPLDEFASLGENDILFIDSTHVVRIASDVCYEFLEIVPRLARGVYVHVHDIFLPAQYPKRWTFSSRFFWAEQYLLQAFLAFNDTFEVVWPGHLMHLEHSDELAEAFPAYAAERPGPGGFWMARVK